MDYKFESKFRQLSLDDSVSQIPVLENLTKDIEKFNNYVYKYGGHTGGWSVSDHSYYLKLRKKQNFGNTVRLLQNEFPDITKPDIINHDSWFNKYMELKMNYQRALKFWRLQKCPTDYLPSVQNPINFTPVNPEEEHKQLLEREKIKAKIQSWKDELKIRKNMEEESKKKSEQELKEKSSFISQKQKIESQLIRNNRREITNLQHAIKVAEETEQRNKKKLVAKKANQMISKFRERDFTTMMKKKIQNLELINKKESQESKLQTLAYMNKKFVQTSRDPERILKPTKEWENKKRKLSLNLTINTMNNFKPFMSLEDIDHRGIPEWRKEMNGEK